jgi:hypothetical protein
MALLVVLFLLFIYSLRRLQSRLYFVGKKENMPKNRIDKGQILLRKKFSQFKIVVREFLGSAVSDKAYKQRRLSLETGSIFGFTKLLPCLTIPVMVVS